MCCTCGVAQSRRESFNAHRAAQWGASNSTRWHCQQTTRPSHNTANNLRPLSFHPNPTPPCAVEAVAPYRMLAVPVVWQAVHEGRVGHGLVERRVKHTNLVGFGALCVLVDFGVLCVRGGAGGQADRMHGGGRHCTRLFVSCLFSVLCPSSSCCALHTQNTVHPCTLTATHLQLHRK